MTQIATPHGVQLEYELIGDPDRPPLLLIQGLGAQLVGWREEFCHVLADAGFQVIRFDNRDSGLSQKFPGVEYELADMAGDAVGLLDALGVEAAHVVGQSLGGAIAQELVIQAPERVASLGLLYTAPNISFMRTEREWDADLGAAPATTREAAIEQYAADEWWASSEGYAFDTDWIRELGGQMWDRCWYPEGALGQFGAMLRSADHTAALSAVRVPTLVAHGDRDRLVDVSAATVLAEAIPGATLRIFEGLGHEVHRAIWPELVGLIGSSLTR